jgi:hypothetical protein
MKNYFIFFVLANSFFVLSLTNCTKTIDTTDDYHIREEKPQTIPINKDFIVGSWQFIEKSYNSVNARETVHILWEKAESDEKRVFKQNSDYNLYWNKKETCHGAYKIADNGALEVTNNCQSSSETIIDLTSCLLTIKKGDSYFRYHKVN